MTTDYPQTETQETLLESKELVWVTSESNRDKTAETFLDLLGAHVRKSKYSQRLSSGLAVIPGFLFGAPT